MPRIFPILSLLFTASLLAESSTAPFEEPQGELTLRQAMAAALMNSPQLALYP